MELIYAVASFDTFYDQLFNLENLIINKRYEHIDIQYGTLPSICERQGYH